jgi:hypothetical protein
MIESTILVTATSTTTATTEGRETPSAIITSSAKIVGKLNNQ